MCPAETQMVLFLKRKKKNSEYEKAEASASFTSQTWQKQDMCQYVTRKQLEK